MTSWDKFLVSSLKKIASEPLVLDIGGGRPFQKGLKPHRRLFRRSLYLTLDYTDHWRPSLVGDAHRLPIKDQSVSAVICKAVLEHVKNPFQVVAEIYRISRPGAKLLVYVPFLYPYHGHRLYKDYFRFTHDGLRQLFSSWSYLKLKPVRGYFETLAFFLPPPFRRLLTYPARFFDRFYKTPQTSGFYLYAEK